MTGLLVESDDLLRLSCDVYFVDFVSAFRFFQHHWSIGPSPKCGRGGTRGGGRGGRRLTGTGDTEFLVDLLVRRRSAERVDTELLMRVLGPSHSLAHHLVSSPSTLTLAHSVERKRKRGVGREGRTYGVSLDGEDRVTIREDTKLILPSLLIENLKTRHRNDPNLNPLLLEQLNRLDDDGDFGTGRDDGEIGGLGRFVEDVTSFVGEFDGGSDELREVLSGETGGDEVSRGREEGREGRTR